MDRPNQKGYRNNRGKTGKKYKKAESGRIEIAGDFSVVIDPYLWKWLKNDDDYDESELHNAADDNAYDS